MMSLLKHLFTRTYRNNLPKQASWVRVRPPTYQLYNTRTSLRMASTLPRSSVFEALSKHDPKRPAIVHSVSERTFVYGSLLHDVAAAKDILTAATQGRSLKGERVAFLVENGYDYVGLYRYGACA